MANHDRANRDPDERAFDGGDDGDENEGSHLPVVIIITILVLAAFGGVVWLAYNQGVARGRGDAPVRIATAQPVKTDEGGLKVYSQPAGTDEGDTPAKPAATQSTSPAPQPAQVQTPPAVQPTTPAPVQPAPQPTPKTVVQSYPPPVVAPKPQTQVATATQPTPKSEPPAAATKPPAKLGVTQAAPVPAKTVTATPAPAPLKPAVLKPVETANPAAAGGYMLQIGAYKSEDEARAAWKSYQSKHATLLNGFGADVQRTTHDDGSVWYRLRIASFSDKVAASALCDRLKAQGGTCFLAK